jgi:hypothetical protein
MPLILDGNGTIAGLSAGGIPDGSITQADLASNVAGNGPAFAAYIGSSQSVAHATSVKLQFNTEFFDTASCFDTSNYRFTPNVAGYYQINFSYLLTGTATRQYEVNGRLYKNGSSYSDTYISFVMGTGTTMSRVLSCVVYMNGSTDYLEVYNNQYDYGASGGMTAFGGTIYSNFSGSLVRAA